MVIRYMSNKGAKAEEILKHFIKGQNKTFKKYFYKNHIALRTNFTYISFLYLKILSQEEFFIVIILMGFYVKSFIY